MSITATLFGQMITFGLLIWFTMKFVWPPLLSVMEERQKKIADGLAAGEAGLQARETAEAEIAELVTTAKNQASEIVAQAEKRSTEIVEAAKDTARQEGQRLIASAQAELEQEINRARTTLRAEVAAIAVAGAERILAREVDTAQHQQLLGELAKQL
ncbi:MAG: F0F1 ATP synthase subunit B [Gammaproteobacteria bacterium]|nr:F0F1 ATP synthase subunit B [Gammaproteobacteria bacterium]